MGSLDPQYFTSAVEGESLIALCVWTLTSVKVERTRHAVNMFRSGKLSSIGRGSTAPSPPDVPPREDCMRFVDPGHAAKRKGRPAMLHALANIEQWA